MKHKHIGFIGLGAMGLPMALNLLEHGYTVHITPHRNLESIKALVEKGAVEHTTIANLAAEAEVLISILPEDKEMEAVLLAPSTLDRLSSSCILVEMTSGSPEMMKKINSIYVARGIRVLDAPVSGGTIGAQNGTLTVMAGGSEEELEAVRPVLEVMAKNIYLVGEVGAGKAIKAINQMLAAIHMIAAAEAVALSEELGINKDILKQVIGNSSGGSWMMLNKVDDLSRRSYIPGFKHKLMKKDVQIAVNEGINLKLPLANQALQMFLSSEKQDGDLDFSSIGKYILT